MKITFVMLALATLILTSCQNREIRKLRGTWEIQNADGKDRLTFNRNGTFLRIWKSSDGVVVQKGIYDYINQGSVRFVCDFFQENGYSHDLSKRRYAYVYKFTFVTDDMVSFNKFNEFVLESGFAGKLDGVHCNNVLVELSFYSNTMEQTGRNSNTYNIVYYDDYFEIGKQKFDYFVSYDKLYIGEGYEIMQKTND